MKLGVRGKLFAVSVALVVGAVGIAGAFLEHQIRTWLEARLEHELLGHARASALLVREAGGGLDAGLAHLDGLADRMGDATEARVTIVAADGHVAGDSELSLAELATVENHGERPEVLEARARGTGRAVRYSTTLRTGMVYVAVALAGDDATVVRVAMPLADVDAAVRRLRVLFGLAGLLGLAVAVFMSALASHLMTRTLRGLVRAIRDLGRGERAGRLPVESLGDELGVLGGSINRLAGELDGAVQSLVHERDRLEAVLEGMSDAVLALDAEARIDLVNGAALDLLGLDEAPVGRPLLEVVRVPALEEVARSALRGRASEGELDLAPTGGETVRLLARATPQRETGGCVLVLVDVTESRRLETMRRDFVANVSHELRTPVSTILANAETLRDGALEDPDRARQFLGALIRNAERLARLLADVLDLARIESGAHPAAPRPLSVERALRQAVRHFEDVAAGRSARVEVVDEGGGLPDLRVEAEEGALEQVLGNLIDNALKYGGSEVRLRASRVPAGDAVRIEVEDDGPGVPSHQRDRLFERFYRVDPGRSRAMGGTGLGLSIAKHLVETLGGEIGMEPATPRGSIFWFRLPASAATDPAADAREPVVTS